MGVAGFVDIHCHVLPGLDDGPADMQEALLLGETARAAGTAAIVATPHCSLRYPLRCEERDRRLRLTEAASADLPILFPGCELELAEERLEAFYDAPGRYTLNAGQYVLVELPLSCGSAALGPAARLFADRGLRPILAHPERYPFLAPDSRAIAAWIAHGGLLQATAASFTGRMGRRAQSSALELLRRGALHFVASDAHHAVKRGPDLRQAFTVVAEASDLSSAGRLFNRNPLAAVRDEPIVES